VPSACPDKESVYIPNVDSLTRGDTVYFLFDGNRDDMFI
jgi:hypothetical protein